MTVAFGIDAMHLAAEELAVGGSVVELVDGDVIMDHLMEDGVLDELFGQVKTGVNAKDEVVIGPRAEEPFAMFDKGEFAKERAGIGQFDRDRRQGTAEKAGVELVKTGLDVINCWDHENVRRTNVRCTIYVRRYRCRNFRLLVPDKSWHE